MSEKNTYHVIGLMSGTSLDGLDIVYCAFTLDKGVWSYEIREACTIAYPQALHHQLANSTSLSGLALNLLDIEMGKWMGEEVKKFMQLHQLSIDLVASHGHTVFHQPDKGLTLQIGSGLEILNACKTTVICDFRSKDVSLGGNGAPLVPIGDQLLFGDYEGCLNLGGIANISFQKNGKRIAYDLSPANIVLNQLAQQLGKPFDTAGNIARQGSVSSTLFEKLNALPYYHLKPPKSLGYEWVEKHLFPLLKSSSLTIEDQMTTMVEHITQQISKHLPIGKTLITGGGAYNNFLMERLVHMTNDDQLLSLPNDLIIAFKEAMIFAFLGVLKLRSEVNCLKSVTGASEDNSGGIIYYK